MGVGRRVGSLSAPFVKMSWGRLKGGAVEGAWGKTSAGQTEEHGPSLLQLWITPGQFGSKSLPAEDCPSQFGIKPCHLGTTMQ